MGSARNAFPSLFIYMVSSMLNAVFKWFEVYVEITVDCHLIVHSFSVEQYPVVWMYHNKFSHSPIAEHSDYVQIWQL